MTKMKGRPLKRGASTGGFLNKAPSVSFFGTVATAGAIILYLISASFTQSGTFDNSILMWSILISGIVLSAFFVGFIIMPFNLKNFLIDIIATIISLGCLLFVRSLFAPSVMSIQTTTFLMLSGVAEEWFFRMFLCNWIDRHMPIPFIISVPISSFVWALFHLNVYGGATMTLASSLSNPLLIYVFMAGLPLGVITILTRSADGPMFGHMIANAL